MGIFFDAPVEPDALTTYVRNVPADTGFRLTDLFPTRVHPNNTVDTAEITRTNRTARFRAFDGRLHVSSRDTGSIKQFKLPAVSSSLSMGEYERLQLLFAQTGGTNQAAIANAVYNDATNLTREVQARIEQAWGDVLTDGKLTIDEEGYITEADYGVPGSQIVSAGTAYTTIATATALADFITWCDTYNTNNGFLPGYFQTSLRVMRLLQQNAQIINAIAGAAATRSRVTNQEVADLSLDRKSTVGSVLRGSRRHRRCRHQGRPAFQAIHVHRQRSGPGVGQCQAPDGCRRHLVEWQM
jgi:hypothetical protein